MSKCGVCGTAYTDARIFCGKCRAVVGLRCVCGAANAMSDTFCGQCGLNLHEHAADGADSSVPVATTAAARDILGETRAESAHFARLTKRMHSDDIKTLFRSKKGRP